MVFSPVVALPSAWMPPIAASSAATRTSAGRLVGVGGDGPPARMKAVPYSGPAAPPTVLIRVRPAVRRRRPARAGRRRPRAARVERRDDGREAAVHVGAVVAVADRLVERGQRGAWSWSRAAARRSQRLDARRASRDHLGSGDASRVVVERPPRRREVRAAAGRRDRDDAGSDAPAQGRGVDRRIPQRGQLVVEAQERDREAGHLEARDVVADERAADRRCPCSPRILATLLYAT